LQNETGYSISFESQPKKQEEAMYRPLVALSALVVIAAPAAAATYTATTSASAPAKIPARDILWKCASGTCTGATENSRPLVLCQGLAKQAGPIDAFNVNGRAIGSEELARCNAMAKPVDRSTAVANAR
jgi:hypothetical protein